MTLGMRNELDDAVPLQDEIIGSELDQNCVDDDVISGEAIIAKCIKNNDWRL